MNTALALPARSGPRPSTNPTTPHIQRDQWAPAPLAAELWQRMIRLPGVTTGRSGVSAPSSRALHLDQRLAKGPREAFMVGTEFAHLHGDGSGSLHLALPRDVAQHAIERGWAEPHPVVAMGLGPPTLVMLYGPRDSGELDVVWGLVETSHGFATGG
jgi:Family of unknown function (DUF5519)